MTPFSSHTPQLNLSYHHGHCFTSSTSLLRSWLCPHILIQTWHCRAQWDRRDICIGFPDLCCQVFSSELRSCHWQVLLGHGSPWIWISLHMDILCLRTQVWSAYRFRSVLSSQADITYSYLGAKNFIGAEQWDTASAPGP